MRRYLLYLTLLACLSGCSQNVGVVDLGSMLDQMLDPFAPTLYPATGYEAMQTSSYDRRSVTPDNESWFANDDGFGFIRTDTIDGCVEKVLFDEQQGGVITRIWITTRNPRSTLRFYFDGHIVPDWVVNSFDLTAFGLDALNNNPLLLPHTSYERGVKGGQTFFLPIPYSKSCKITLEEPAGWSGVPRYYHINFRRYDIGTPIKTFSVEEAKKYSQQIIAAGQNLKKTLSPKGKRVSVSGIVEVGETMTLALPRGNRAVTKLVVKTAIDSAAYAQTTRDLVVTATFDGNRTICVPLSDFFGGGMGAPAIDCRQMSSDGNGTFASFWVMPYSSTAEIAVVNNSQLQCGIEIEATTVRHKFGDNTLYFHSSWHAAEKLYVTNIAKECKDWNFAQIEGRGIYVGDVLTLFNHSKAWYGEGDEKIWVDNDIFPSHFGTGTEDYYNSSWAPVTVFNTPFGGAPRADLASSRGYNTFLRTRLNDAIPFENKLRFDLELISWVPGVVDYATTAYWYGDVNSRAVNTSDPLTTHYLLPTPSPNPAAFTMPNSIEFENLIPVAKSDALQTDRQSMLGFSDGVWSGGKQTTCFGGAEGDFITYTIDSLETDTHYLIDLYATKAADYGTVAIFVNSKQIATFDAYFASVVNSDAIELGEAVSKEGRITVSVKITGKNPQSLGYMFGLDCIKLTKIE